MAGGRDGSRVAARLGHFDAFCTPVKRRPPPGLRRTSPPRFDTSQARSTRAEGSGRT